MILHLVDIANTLLDERGDALEGTQDQNL